MKNNFELYDSIKGMLAANKPEQKAPSALSEKDIAAYAKKQPGSVIGGVDFGSIKEAKEKVVSEAETIERDKHGNVISREGDKDREVAPKRIKLTKGWGDGGKSMKTSYGKLTKEDVELTEEELQVIADNITEEEFEQLDELSKEKLGQYINRSLNDVRNANQARIRWQNHKGADYRGLDPKGNPVTKTPKEMEDHHSKLAKNREGGIRLATKKLTKEDTDEDIVEGIFSEDEIAALLEMEQLDELSKETLTSYIAKNKVDPVRIKKRGPTTKAQKAGIAKRDAGHEVASSKLAKIHKKESDAAFAAHANKVHEASNKFMKAAHDHLTGKGYTFHGEHKHEGAVYSKYHPHNGVLNTYKVKRGDGIHSNPSIVHTSIQGHSYSGNSPHHHRVSIFQDHENEHSHENIAAGVHKYVDYTEHDSHHDVSRDHHWKDEQAKKNK